MKEEDKKLVGESLLDDIHSSLQELLKIQEQKIADYSDPELNVPKQLRIIDYLNEIVILLNAESRILYVNKTVEELLGYPTRDFPGNEFFRFVHPDDIERYRVYFIRNWPDPHSTFTIRRIRLESHDGEWVPFELRGRIIAEENGNFVIVSLRRLQSTETHEHLPAVNPPDAGMGYHFSRIVKNYRTQLAVIQKAIKMLETNRGQQEQRYYLHMVDSAVERGWQELKKLMNYMDPGEPDIQVLPAGQLVRSFKEVIEPLLPGDYKILVENNAADELVKADPDQIQRVFSILSSNAIEAMVKGGSITIGTDFEPRKKPSGRKSEDLPTHIRFLVSDTGTGIPSALLPFVFYPYITTKKNRAVSGMGLAIARIILQVHDGWIDIAHSSNTGTTMVFALPRVQNSGRYMEKAEFHSRNKTETGNIEEFDYLHDLIDSVMEGKEQSR